MPRLIITEGEIMLQEAMKTLEDAEAKAAEIVKEAGSGKLFTYHTSDGGNAPACCDDRRCKCRF